MSQLVLDVEAELTSYCQLACPCCRTGKALRDKYPDVPRGFMTRETFKKIIFTLPSIRQLLLYNWGEPFLHPDLIWFATFGKKMSQWCELSTNMQIMNEELATGIVQAGVDQLLVSCDGITQESYGQYRRDGSLAKVLGNTALLRQIRERLGTDTPKIVFQFVVQQSNYHELPAYESFARAHGADNVRIIPLCPMTPEGLSRLDEMAVTNAPEWRYNSIGTTRGCQQPWKHMTFDWNGDVYTCCNPSGIKAYSMGNINENSFDEIWNGEKYLYARRFCETANAEDNGMPVMCHACYGVFPSEEARKSDLWGAVSGSGGCKCSGMI